MLMIDKQQQQQQEKKKGMRKSKDRNEEEEDKKNQQMNSLEENDWKMRMMMKGQKGMKQKKGCVLTVDLIHSVPYWRESDLE